MILGNFPISVKIHPTLSDALETSGMAGPATDQGILRMPIPRSMAIPCEILLRICKGMVSGKCQEATMVFAWLAQE